MSAIEKYYAIEKYSKKYQNGHLSNSYWNFKFIIEFLVFDSSLFTFAHS